MSLCYTVMAPVACTWRLNRRQPCFCGAQGPPGGVLSPLEIYLNMRVGKEGNLLLLLAQALELQALCLDLVRGEVQERG